MRALLVLLFLMSGPLAAQPGLPLHERNVARIGVGIGPPEASGVSLWTPNVGYGVPCLGSTYLSYECGSYAVAFFSDGEYEYDVLTSHTLHLAPEALVGPYITGFAGVGYGDEAGFVWGGEAGVNLWVTPSGGFTVYGGVIRGERQRYVRLGVGLVVVTPS